MKTTEPKAILQYTLDGDFVAEHKSAKEAAKQFGGSYKTKTRINNCCNINRRDKTFKGFIWKYKS